MLKTLPVIKTAGENTKNYGYEKKMGMSEKKREIKSIYLKVSTDK